jgi:CRP-like cAMP-binding protein
MELIDHISRNPYFSELPLKNIEAIISLAIRKKYLKGEFIVHKEDIWSYLLYVHTAEIVALKESIQGRVFIVESFSPGDIFWGLALFQEDRPNPVALKSTQDGEILLWHKQALTKIIDSNPQFTWSLFQLMAEKMERAGEILEGLVFQPLTCRLASFLLDQYKGAVDEYVTRDLTLEEMASRIGTTREMVCKILYKFSDDGLIDIERTQLKINDKEKLSLIAER